VNVKLRPYDAATMRRTNGTLKRAGYFLTVWFNELFFTSLEGSTAATWDFYKSVDESAAAVCKSRTF